MNAQLNWSQNIRRSTPRLVLSLLAALLAMATGARAGSPVTACRRAAAASSTGLPAGLLSAIGTIESGRPDPATGSGTAWPYTVDVDGTGYWFGSESAAASFVRAAWPTARAIDVGCFQIDLQDHPDAFASLRAAFDPVANAQFAARFLRRLHDRLGSWQAAVAAYHSATPSLGAPYARLVEAAWHNTVRPAGITRTIADPHVIHLQPGPLRPTRQSLPRIVTP